MWFRHIEVLLTGVAESESKQSARAYCVERLVCLPARAVRVIVLIEPRDYSFTGIFFENVGIRDKHDNAYDTHYDYRDIPLIVHSAEEGHNHSYHEDEQCSRDVVLHEHQSAHHGYDNKIGDHHLPILIDSLLAPLHAPRTVHYQCHFRYFRRLKSRESEIQPALEFLLAGYLNRKNKHKNEQNKSYQQNRERDITIKVISYLRYDIHQHKPDNSEYELIFYIVIRVILHSL